VAEQFQTVDPIITADALSSKRRLRDLPWWLFALFLIAIYVFFAISANEDYNAAFVFIKTGLIIVVLMSSMFPSLNLVVPN